jgi:predicted ATPase
MHVRRIRIEEWRNFRNLEFSVPSNAPVVCVVGPNGSGKSNLLELISAAAHRAGLSSGYETNRGDVFGQRAVFEIEFFIAPGTSAALDEVLAQNEGDPAWKLWDRTLTVGQSRNDTQVFGKTIAGGVDASYAMQMAANVVSAIRNTASVHYMFLDADRAYPKLSVSTNQVGEILQRNWMASTRNSSFRLTRALYEEWFQYLLGAESQGSDAHVREIRRARAEGRREPEFVDHFDDYRAALQKVLPHLRFVGVDSQSRQVEFDSAGASLKFDQLSGGEREIAFLIGQIERFGLRKGLLLVDEPELHLHHDLLRSWIAFLKSTVEDGQIWLSTHALEVVEATGQEATIVLERDQSTRAVTAAVPLSTRPVMATLARAVGWPAFSMSNLAFVFIEGDGVVGERERFQLLCGAPEVRFLTGGSCKEVIRHCEDLRRLADEGHQELRVGGVIDQDWRSKADCEQLRTRGLHVLGVHEIENLYLHPPTLEALMVQLGQSLDLPATLQHLCDERAARWIFDSARTQTAFVDYPPPSSGVRQLLSEMKWCAFAGQIEATCANIASFESAFSFEQQREFQKHLIVRAKTYERKRDEPDLWQVCHGKQVFRAMVPILQFKDQDAAERAIQALWRRNAGLVPQQLLELRQYVQGL